MAQRDKGDPKYDLVLRGGTLLDPGQSINGRRDIALKGGKVAAVAERIDPALAAEVVDVTGKLVTPGLIDLHGHFYHRGIGVGVNADEPCLSSGVTTGVDGGSAGWANYGAMRDYVFPPRKTRLLAFLHIGAAGLLLNRVVGGELHDIRVADADRTADTIKENPGFLIGVKVRIDTKAVSGWEAATALKRAREAADKAGVRLMVHIAHTPIPLPEILEQLGPGDIATHAFAAHNEGILDKNDKIRPDVRAAADRGVVMDVGDAGSLFDVDIARTALNQGFPPTTISTDMFNAPPTWTLYRMNDLVSRFHALGLPLEEAVAASTVRPARVIGLDHEIGSLAPGMVGDVAVFDQREGEVQWRDNADKTVRGRFRLDPFLTLRDGVVVWREGHLVDELGRA